MVSRPYGSFDREVGLCYAEESVKAIYASPVGEDPPRDGSEWEELTRAVATSELDRQQTTGRLRRVFKARGGRIRE
jgi:hypothetical protein